MCKTVLIATLFLSGCGPTTEPLAETCYEAGMISGRLDALGIKANAEQLAARNAIEADCSFPPTSR